jgi:tetratricopeptide (TPR) repeat protein
VDLDTLRRIESFASLPLRQLAQASRRLVWRRYAAGELILPHQVPLRLDGLVYRGRIQIVTVWRGHRETIGHVQAGEPINGTFWTRQALPVELRAAEATTLCLLPSAGARPTALAGLPPDGLPPAPYPGLFPYDLPPATFPEPGPQLTGSAAPAAFPTILIVNRVVSRILLCLLVLLLGFAIGYWPSLWRIPLSQVTYGLASRRLDAGAHADALSFLQTSVELNSRMASAYNDMGTIFYRQGRPQEAQAAFRQAVTIDSTFAAAQNNLGLSYLEDGQLELARAALGQAVMLNPESEVAWTNAGIAEQLAGQYERATRAYRAALRLNPQNATAQANLGILYYEQERFPEAQSHLEAALAARPELARARAILGAIALSEDDHVRAWSELQTASPDLADDPLLHFYTALWYEEAGIWESAEQELDKVLTLDPHPDLAALVHSHLLAIASYD